MKKEVFIKRLGENIAKIREEKGLSQTELAIECKKRNRQSISRLELGQMNPSAYYLYEIAKGLKVPVAELLDF